LLLNLLILHAHKSLPIRFIVFEVYEVRNRHRHLAYSAILHQLILFSSASPIKQLNIPKGPSISTVLRASLRANFAFFLAAGCTTLNVTSGGIERGAPPMCEARGVDEEKDLKEGRRNDGTEKEGVEAIALSRPFERVVDSIVAASRLKELDGSLEIILEIRTSENGT
jgi:hypothetical protein